MKSPEEINGVLSFLCKTHDPDVWTLYSTYSMYVLKTAKCPPGCNGNTRFSLSIHIRERPVLQTEACVHMSLNNNSINIQCFHYCQKRRAPSLGCIGIERKAAQTPTEKKNMCVCSIFIEADIDGRLHVLWKQTEGAGEEVVLFFIFN